MKNFVKIIFVIILIITILIVIFNMFQFNRIIGIAEQALTGGDSNERIALAQVVALQNGVTTFKTTDGFISEWEMEPFENFEYGKNYYLISTQWELPLFKTISLLKLTGAFERKPPNFFILFYKKTLTNARKCAIL